mgnify:CR=1 FL=1
MHAFSQKAELDKTSQVPNPAALKGSQYRPTSMSSLALFECSLAQQF